MSVTLATARSEVAARASEFLASTTTQTTDTTHVTDTTSLQHQDAYWAESTILFTSGANNGQSRRTQTFTAASSTAVLYNAVPTTIQSGVSYEVYRRFTPGDIKTAINRTINIAAPDFREKVRAVATATADTLQYAFPTGPALMGRELVGIEYQFYTQAGQSTWPFTRLSADLYDVIEDFDGTFSEKKLQLRFNPETNRLIRFIFDGALGNVSADADVIHLDLPELEFLYSQAVAELWRIEASRNTDSVRAEALSELARAESFADRVRRQLQQEHEPRPLKRTRFSVI